MTTLSTILVKILSREANLSNAALLTLAGSLCGFLARRRHFYRLSLTDCKAESSYNRSL
jgi:hypothetical protein